MKVVPYLLLWLFAFLFWGTLIRIIEVHWPDSWVGKVFAFMH